MTKAQLEKENAALRAAITVDLGRADRDSMYRHDLKSLVNDGATGGCHTDVGTIIRERLRTIDGVWVRLKRLTALCDEAEKEGEDTCPVCNEFMRIDPGNDPGICHPCAHRLLADMVVELRAIQMAQKDRAP